jgi:hypothetical protein
VLYRVEIWRYPLQLHESCILVTIKHSMAVLTKGSDLFKIFFCIIADYMVQNLEVPYSRRSPLFIQPAGLLLFSQNASTRFHRDTGNLRSHRHPTLFLLRSIIDTPKSPKCFSVPISRHKFCMYLSCLLWVMYVPPDLSFVI